LTGSKRAEYNNLPRKMMARHGRIATEKRRRVSVRVSEKVAPAAVDLPKPVLGKDKPVVRLRGGKSAAMAEAEREVLLTADGLRKLEEELEFLKTERRREVAERIKVAREFGDLSENAEYEAAKNEQAFVETRIMAVEALLRNARIVQDADVDPRRVNLGTTVTLRDLDSGEVVEYTIVGSSEADPSNNRISYECPVGRSVFGQGSGAKVEVRLPSGTARYEIVALSR
jgi:transcription elongation factor GreA